MKRIISLTLIFIIFALSSCGGASPEDGGTEPELTPYERAMAFESEANLAMENAVAKIELIYSGLSSYDCATLVYDEGKMHLSLSDVDSQVSMVFISDTAYIRTSVRGYETKRKRNLTKDEALLIISELVSRSLKLQVSDFVTAVCREEGDKTTVTCMLPSERTKSRLLTQLDLNPLVASVELAEYSFTVEDGKYVEMSYLLTLSPDTSSRTVSISFTADFEYTDACSVELPSDLDEYTLTQ